MFKIVFLSIALIFSSQALAAVSVNIDGEVYSCSKSGDGHHGGTYRCVPNCTNRSTNGVCNSYAPDFCGKNASCAQNCTSRGANGRCHSYSQDICRRSGE